MITIIIILIIIEKSCFNVEYNNSITIMIHIIIVIIIMIIIILIIIMIVLMIIIIVMILMTMIITIRDGNRRYLHRQMRITFGVIANHFGKVIRQIFVALANNFWLIANHFSNGFAKIRLF